jgi:hypothetical protein
MSTLRPVQPPPPVAPYHPPPAYPPPPHGAAQQFDNGALIALEVGIVGLVLGVPLGVPGLVCGPLAYFMGRSAVGRLEASGLASRNRTLARTAWILGIVATAVGAVVSVAWLVFLLLSISGPPAQ